MMQSQCSGHLELLWESVVGFGRLCLKRKAYYAFSSAHIFKKLCHILKIMLSVTKIMLL